VNYDDKLKHAALKTSNVASMPSGIKISANPNPATTWVTFEFELPDEINSVKLTISDAQGRTVDKLTLTGRQGQKLLIHTTISRECIFIIQVKTIKLRRSLW